MGTCLWVCHTNFPHITSTKKATEYQLFHLHAVQHMHTQYGKEHGQVHAYIVIVHLDLSFSTSAHPIPHRVLIIPCIYGALLQEYMMKIGVTVCVWIFRFWEYLCMQQPFSHYAALVQDISKSTSCDPSFKHTLPFTAHHLNYICAQTGKKQTNWRLI